MRKRNTKTVSKLIPESEYKTRNGLKPNPFTKVHQEREMVILEGMSAEAMDGAATDLGKKFKEWLEEQMFSLENPKRSGEYQSK